LYILSKFYLKIIDERKEILHYNFKSWISWYRFSFWWRITFSWYFYSRR